MGPRGKALSEKAKKAPYQGGHLGLDMLSLFQRKRPSPTPGAPPSPPIAMPKGLMRPQSAASLLATARPQRITHVAGEHRAAMGSAGAGSVQNALADKAAISAGHARFFFVFAARDH